MMDTILEEKNLTFKGLEKIIFQYICQLAQQVTVDLLEKLDEELRKNRDRKVYRHKGKKKTTIKTVYGEVTFSRRVYETLDENGMKKFVFLLDDYLKMEQIGLMSNNLVEHILSKITSVSYRECARQITETTGQRISTQGVWNIVQVLGEKLNEEEKQLLEAHKQGKLNGEKEVPVLFEEADGVYVSMQGKDRKEGSKGKAEIKVAIAYDGWKETAKDRFELDGKVVTAGFMKTKEFHEVREAMIAKNYNLDEINHRILNADGASWIKKVKDKSTIFQLDPFHRNKAVKENILRPKAVKDIMELLDKKDIRGTFDYLDMYRNSLDDEKEIEKAEILIKYFKSNRAGLIPYQERGIKLPNSPKGLLYRSMGTMENHIWSVVAKRMKHNHTSWSKKGGDNIVKVLAKKSSGKLHEVTECIKHPIFKEVEVEEILEKKFSAADIAERIGTGYAYPVTGHLVRLDVSVKGERQKLFSIAGT